MFGLCRGVPYYEDFSEHSSHSEQFYHLQLEKWAEEIGDVLSLEELVRRYRPQPMSKASLERIRPILKEMDRRLKRRDDTRDFSVHPSYSTVDQPYHFKCAGRYLQKTMKYENQFQKELRQLLRHTPTAFEQMNLYCKMTYTSLWPPLHNNKEILYTRRRILNLSRKDRARITYLMSHEVY